MTFVVAVRSVFWLALAVVMLASWAPDWRVFRREHPSAAETIVFVGLFWGTFAICLLAAFGLTP
jgi:hypothetical protein